jgi:peptide-methionine (S)-S-oxide reductase
MKRILSALVIFTGFIITPLKAEEKMHKENKQIAIFAMGCFWCGESEFRDHTTGNPLPGILSLRVGYAGGTQPNPTYESHTGYKEAVKIEFDPSTISYEKLLDIFWHNVDPVDAKGQFCDKGFPYTSVIYYQDSQKEAALASLKNTQKILGQEIATELIPATTFYDAEEYHQDYKKKNPIRYRYYRWNCGRDQRLKDVWGGSKSSDETTH